MFYYTDSSDVNTDILYVNTYSSDVNTNSFPLNAASLPHYHYCLTVGGYRSPPFSIGWFSRTPDIPSVILSILLAFSASICPPIWQSISDGHVLTAIWQSDKSGLTQLE